MNKSQKICLYCNRSLSESFFGVALTRNGKIYRRRKCADCYKSTKQKLIQKYFRWLNDYKKQKGCSRCKTTDVRVLDFHHKGNNDKLFTIDGFRRSVGFERIQNEVKKCDVLCANCHRIVHDEARKATKLGE